MSDKKDDMKANKPDMSPDQTDSDETVADETSPEEAVAGDADAADIAQADIAQADGAQADGAQDDEAATDADHGAPDDDAALVVGGTFAAGTFSGGDTWLDYEERAAPAGSDAAETADATVSESVADKTLTSEPTAAGPGGPDAPDGGAGASIGSGDATVAAGTATTGSGEAAASTPAHGTVPVITAVDEPAPGCVPPKKIKPRRGRRARYLRRATYLLGAMTLLPVIAFVVIYLMTPIPNSAQPAAKAQQSVFYYSDGKTVIARAGAFDRRPVPLTQVPKPVRDAVISAENRSFYSDPGVSLTGTARAVWATLTGGSMQGGSTITQQMVRNYYSGLSQKRTAGRKLKEIMVALKVGREKSKDWILEQYLNTIYFGRDAYGIEAAAKAYYNKDVQNLTPSEGAYLAAAIQVPTYASDPTGEAHGYLEARWKYVVDGMVQMKAISPQDAAAMRFPMPQKQKQKSVLAGDKGYMFTLVKAELKRMGYTDNQINMGGLRVTTTFDRSLMEAAKQAVENNIPVGTSKKVMTGLVSVDPANGEVKAFYGGKDFLDRQFNAAFDAQQQAGSGFKPYVLAAALSGGVSLDDYVDGSSPQTFGGTEIHNDDNENFGQVNLVTATQYSINTAYVNLGQEVGLDKVVAMAEKLGIPASQLQPHAKAATLPLGVANVTVEQQAAAYAAFAAEGVYHAPHVIRSLVDWNGEVHKTPTTGKKVFSATVAHDATYAMQKVVDAGTGINASLPDRNAAGKTGTTSKGKQIWFNGFIPQLASSVGIFRSDNKPLSIPGYSAYGGELPARIWRAYMIEADRRYPPKQFDPPSVYPGGYGRSTPTAQPRPRPSVSRPSPQPSMPTEGPTAPPTGRPTRFPPPTGLPTGFAAQDDGRDVRDVP